LRSNQEKQQSYEFVSIEDLVPADHMLRKIDKYIDFTFIDEKVRHLYAQDNGRPAIDPLVLFKMIFLGYFYGIRSERQLEREVQTNLAYRWFLGLGLTDRVPDHTTISWNRRTRFKVTSVFQDIFDEIVLQAITHRMVGGRVLMATDLSIYHRGGWQESQATVTGSHSIIIWESSDLVNWSEPRMVEVAPKEAGCAWAIIDTTIIKAGGMYYRASGDGQITIESSERLMGEWKVISTLESLGLELTGKNVEGPEFFKFNGEEKWGLLVDQ
ncbi:Transposase, partial [Paenibacillus algorifonticola]